MSQTAMDTDKNSKLVRGIIIGGIIGGALTLMDSTTRNKVKNAAAGLKNSSRDMINEVKENPGEVKNQMIVQFKNAAQTLKEAIGDVQKLYERVNQDIFGRVNEIKDFSSEAMVTAQAAKNDLKEIGSKVKEAGAELKVNPLNGSSDTNGSSSLNSKPNTSETYESSVNTFSNRSTANNYGSNTSSSDDKAENAFLATPDEQKNDNNR